MKRESWKNSQRIFFFSFQCNKPGFEDRLRFLLASCMEDLVQVTASLLSDYLVQVQLSVTSLGKSTGHHGKSKTGACAFTSTICFALLALQLDQNHTLAL